MGKSPPARGPARAEFNGPQPGPARANYLARPGNTEAGILWQSKQYARKTNAFHRKVNKN